MNRWDGIGWVEGAPVPFRDRDTSAVRIHLVTEYEVPRREGRPQIHRDRHVVVFRSKVAEAAMNLREGEQLHVTGTLVYMRQEGMPYPRAEIRSTEFRRLGQPMRSVDPD